MIYIYLYIYKHQLQQIPFLHSLFNTQHISFSIAFAFSFLDLIAKIVNENRIKKDNHQFALYDVMSFNIFTDHPVYRLLKLKRNNPELKDGELYRDVPELNIDESMEKLAKYRRAQKAQQKQVEENKKHSAQTKPSNITNSNWDTIDDERIDGVTGRASYSAAEQIPGVLKPQHRNPRAPHPLEDQTKTLALACLMFAVLAKGWVWYGTHVTHGIMSKVRQRQVAIVAQTVRAVPSREAGAGTAETLAQQMVAQAQKKDALNTARAARMRTEERLWGRVDWLEFRSRVWSMRKNPVPFYTMFKR